MPTPNKSNDKSLAKADGKAASAVNRVSMTATQYYEGPIPPAGELEHYEAVLPGAADRILTMAENQSAHRRDMEDKMLESSIKANRRGQNFGFAIFSIVFVAGFALIYAGKDVMGMIALITSITSLVAIFLGTHRGSEKELQEKDSKISKKR